MAIQLPAMADVRPTLLSTVIVGLMAVIFILFLKFVAIRFNVPVIRDIAGAI